MTAPLNVYRLRAAGAARDTLVVARSMESALSLFMHLARSTCGSKVPERIELVGELEAIEPTEAAP